MIPSNARLSPHYPSFDYNIKHSFAWPPHNGAGPAGTFGAEGAHLAGAGGGVAGAGEAASANLARQMHWHHYHGRGGWGRPRFGFGRRFIWFGLGALAASWYYKHHEQRRQHERSIAYPTTGPNSYSSTSPEPSYASGHWKHEWSWPAPSQSTPQQYKPFNPPTPPPPAPAAPAQTEAQLKSAILAELQSSSLPSEPVVKPVVEERRRWGWGARHRRHRDESVPEVVPSATAGVAQEPNQEEMKRKLRDAVETMWEERKASAVQAQEKVNEQARAYAKQKVEKLSAALEALRDSLETETDKKIRKASEKLV